MSIKRVNLSLIFSLFWLNLCLPEIGACSLGSCVSRPFNYHHFYIFIHVYIKEPFRKSTSELNLLTIYYSNTNLFELTQLFF